MRQRRLGLSFLKKLRVFGFFSHLREPQYWGNFKPVDEFEWYCKEGQLPNYVWVAPRFFPVPEFPENDQHPSHDVSLGELFIKWVYETLRASPQWNSSALIITYDEHGGFYDHVPTPLHVPNPDGRISSDPPFDFTRLGVRVPTIIASPWINPGTVVHEAQGPMNNSQYEHSSIAATLKKIFGLPNFLTKRDEWAGTFEQVFLQRTTPRTDCPTSLPTPPPDVMPKPIDHPLNDLQKSFIKFASVLNGDFETGERFKTALEGGEYVRQQVSEFLKRDMFSYNKHKNL